MNADPEECAVPAIPETPTDATPLSEAVAGFEAEGFTGQFAAREGATVVCYTCHETVPANEVELVALIRSEGASDPDDMVAVAAVICPRCGAKGTLVLKFGAIATAEDEDVLAALEDHRGPDSTHVNT
jgi:hypothetical protein